MTHIYKLLLAMLLCIVPASQMHSRVQIDGLYYDIDETSKTAAVSRQSNVSGDLVIPSAVEYNDISYQVTSIGSGAFYNCSGLTSVTIPASVTSIGYKAFSDCISLTSITIPASVTSIGEYAFQGCSSLTSITIPASVTSIGSNAFEGCSSLTSITIPASVTSIGYKAFSDCISLTSITIPASVTSIGEYAFQGCSGLTSITIPESVTSIGDGAFSWCSGLESIMVASGNAVYDSRDNCNAIIHTESNSLISGCQNTIIPESVTSIGNYAFQHCSGLTSITIPESVTSIGSSAFSNCSGLTSVTIPASVTSIGNSAFYSCSGLTSITIPASVTSIGYSAFYGCSGLTSITIQSGVTSIGSSAFSGCSGLTSVTIPEGVTSIGSSAFYNCSNLFDVTINSEALISAERTSATSLASVFGTQVKEYVLCNKVTSLGSYAFSNCSGLTSVTIPASVTSIGYYAFEGCSSLTSITIPASVTSIGSSAFSGCYRLAKIICLSSIPPSCNGTSTFVCSTEVRDKYDIYNYATLHVPMGSKEAYSSAYEWRYFNNIKEDMESNGQVFYANLMVKQGTTGYTRQPIKVEEKYTFYIGSLGEYKVNAVTFNGVDVTDEVNNGYYTTPEIKGESVLSISYETLFPNSVKSATLNNVKVTGYDGEINISNIDEPSDVSIYSTDGKLIDNVSSAYGEAKIYVPSEQLYIVKVGTRTFKVAL